MTNDLLVSPLRSPKAKDTLLNDIASKSNGEVAQKYNLTTGRISQIKKANKHIIDQKQQELISLLPSVVDTVKHDVNTNNRLSKHIALDFKQATTELIALKNNLDKTNINLLKITGIIQPQSLISYNLSQDNRTQTTVISDNVLNMFSNHAETLIDTEVIDTIDDTSSDDGSDKS